MPMSSLVQVELLPLLGDWAVMRSPVSSIEEKGCALMRKDGRGMPMPISFLALVPSSLPLTPAPH